VELSKEEVSRWRADPTTKKVMASMGFMIEDCKEMLVDGVEDYSWARGFVSGMRVIFQIEGVDKNEEQAKG